MGNGVPTQTTGSDSNDVDMTGPAWVRKLDEIFNHLDFDKDGYLDWEEIQGYFQRLASKNSSGAEVDAMVKTEEIMWTFDANGDEKISRNEFRKACEKSTNRGEIVRQIDKALQLLRRFEHDLKRGHVLYASLAHPLPRTDTKSATRLSSPRQTEASNASSATLSEQLWDIYVAEDESGTQYTKEIHVTAKLVDSPSIEQLELCTSIDQLKTLMLYLMQRKVSRAQELFNKLQKLELIDEKRNFRNITSVLDADDCAHLGKCVVEQLCWNEIVKRLEYRDALAIATTTASNAMRISSSPSLKHMFPNVQSVSSLQVSLLQNQWWTTVKEEPSHTQYGKPACRGLVVIGVDKNDKDKKQMIHLAVPALTDFAKEVDVSIYLHIASKIKALDGNGNYAPMSTLNIHERHVLAHLVMQHVAYENGSLGFNFHAIAVNKAVRSRTGKDRRISQNSIDRVDDVEFLLKELEFDKSGISRKTSVYSDLKLDDD